MSQESNLPEKSEIGRILRDRLGSALVGMVDRYCSEHFDGNDEYFNDVEFFRNEPLSARMEDFLNFAVRQPETFSVFRDEGVMYRHEIDLVEIDLATGTESKPSFV